MKAKTQKATKREKLPPLAALPPGDLAITEAEAEVLRAVLLPKLQALAEHEAAIQKRGGKAPFKLMDHHGAVITGETKGFDINGSVITAWTAKNGVKVLHKVVDVAERTQPYYTDDTMGDATARLEAVAADFGLPVDVAKHVLTAAASELTARDNTARATATPRPQAAATEMTRKRGPRVKPNPALPATAPEIYRDRPPREELGGKKENIVQFIERVYAPWREILTRADLRRLDDTADKGVLNWISGGKRLPQGLLLTEYELNTDRRQLEAGRRPKQRFARMLREDAPAA